jgi:hypothetical protein
VIHAEQEDQMVWMDETVDFMKERHPELSAEELQQLHGAGIRFCQPVIPHGAVDHTSRSNQDANAA